MKTLFFTLSLALSSVVMANGESMSMREKARGAAGVDEHYTEKLKSNSTREKMEDNPRNPAMVESFQGVDSRNKKQEQKEKKIQD